MLAACTSESENGPSAKISYESVAAAQQVPVTFGTYVGENAITRAGYVGDINTPALLANDNAEFGVFGFYTDNSDFNSSTSTPNFMYNQKVEGSSAVTPVWTYSPVKYWPNETTHDTQSPPAESTATDKLSFFAYAPYVPLQKVGEGTEDDNNGFEPTSGAVNYSYASGITRVSGNAYAGHPIITYKLDNLGRNVDLLWGTASGTDVDINGTPQGTSYVTGAYDNTPTNINLVKQKTGGKVGFDFKHTLARVAGGNMGLAIQTVEEGLGSHNIGTDTRITVKSITITQGNTSMTVGGTFNLATGVWTKTPTATEHLTFTQTINQTTPSSPSTGVWELNNTIVEKTSAPTVTGAAPGTWGNINTGVTTTAVPVFKDAEANVYPLLFFEDEKPSLTFVIDYFVRTKDMNLSTGYSEVEQVITKTVTFANNVLRGKKYSITIKLGMTNVSFTAGVTDWGSGAETPIVNMPLNVTTP